MLHTYIVYSPSTAQGSEIPQQRTRRHAHTHAQGLMTAGQGLLTCEADTCSELSPLLVAMDTASASGCVLRILSS